MMGRTGGRGVPSTGSRMMGVRVAPRRGSSAGCRQALRLHSKMPHNSLREKVDR